MKDFYLKFNDKNEAVQVLIDAGFGVQRVNRDTGEAEVQIVNGVSRPVMDVNTTSTDFTIDMVGEIVTPPVIDLDSETVVTPPVVAQGYHVNIRMLNGSLPVALTPYAVTPKTPKRVFGS